jgi:hypothetical protein
MRKILCLLFLLSVSFSLIACGDSVANSVPSSDHSEVSAECGSAEPDEFTTDATDDAAIIGRDANTGLSPYLSITARRQRLGEEGGWDEVYYTYDLTEGKLQEVCVLPHLSGYTVGIVSLADDAVYFSQRESDNSNDQICKYDIKTGELIPLENENLSYNDLALIDPNTLLVIASTNQHTITPALFDLRTKEFTYMADVNHETFDLYTTGGLLLNYNYSFDNFPWMIFKLSDRYSDAYHKQGPEEEGEAIDHEFIMVSKDLHKSDAYRFTTQFVIKYEVFLLSQISENEVLVEISETIVDWYGTDNRVEFAWRLLTFDGENTSFAQIENPFPAADISQCLTFDGGKTYYCSGGFASGNQYNSGLFIYHCESDEITPILLAGDEILSVANFRSVGEITA